MQLEPYQQRVFEETGRATTLTKDVKSKLSVPRALKGPGKAEARKEWQEQRRLGYEVTSTASGRPTLRPPILQLPPSAQPASTRSRSLSGLPTLPTTSTPPVPSSTPPMPTRTTSRTASESSSASVRERVGAYEALKSGLVAGKKKITSILANKPAAVTQVISAVTSAPVAPVKPVPAATPVTTVTTIPAHLSSADFPAMAPPAPVSSIDPAPYNTKQQKRKLAERRGEEGAKQQEERAQQLSKAPRRGEGEEEAADPLRPQSHDVSGLAARQVEYREQHQAEEQQEQVVDVDTSMDSESTGDTSRYTGDQADLRSLYGDEGEEPFVRHIVRYHDGDEGDQEPCYEADWHGAMEEGDYDDYEGYEEEQGPVLEDVGAEEHFRDPVEGPLHQVNPPEADFVVPSTTQPLTASNLGTTVAPVTTILSTAVAPETTNLPTTSVFVPHTTTVPFAVPTQFEDSTGQIHVIDIHTGASMVQRPVTTLSAAAPEYVPTTHDLSTASTAQPMDMSIAEQQRRAMLADQTVPISAMSNTPVFNTSVAVTRTPALFDTPPAERPVVQQPEALPEGPNVGLHDLVPIWNRGLEGLFQHIQTADQFFISDLQLIKEKIAKLELTCLPLSLNEPPEVDKLRDELTKQLEGLMTDINNLKQLQGGHSDKLKEMEERLKLYINTEVQKLEKVNVPEQTAALQMSVAQLTSQVNELQISHRQVQEHIKLVAGLHEQLGQLRASMQESIDMMNQLMCDTPTSVEMQECVREEVSNMLADIPEKVRHLLQYLADAQADLRAKYRDTLVHPVNQLTEQLVRLDSEASQLTGMQAQAQRQVEILQATLARGSGYAPNIRSS